MAYMYIACPICRNSALVTYEENRLYKCECTDKDCGTMIIKEERSFDDAVTFFESVVSLGEPLKPMHWIDEHHSVVLCPECGNDLMGGFPEDETGEIPIYQCFYCGQAVNPRKATLKNRASSTPTLSE